MHLCVSVALILGVVVVLILGVVVVLILVVVVGLVLVVVVGLVLVVVVGLFLVMLVVLAGILVVLAGMVMVLAGMVTFYTFGRLHFRRIQRTDRPVRKGDETSAIGSESVEGLRYGGPLLRRAGGALEAEHGFRGELQIDREAGAVHGQT